MFIVGFLGLIVQFCCFVFMYYVLYIIFLLCVIPEEIAEGWGWDLSKMGAATDRLNCACGNSFKSYRYKIGVRVFDINNNPVQHKVWVHFAKTEQPLISREFMACFKKIEFDFEKRIGYLAGSNDTKD